MPDDLQVDPNAVDEIVDVAVDGSQNSPVIFYGLRYSDAESYVPYFGKADLKLFWRKVSAMAQEAGLYMVTLYDLTCHPTADWTINFFTNDIEDFQSRRFKPENDEGRKERFLRPKSGSFETDYYGVK